MFHTEKREEKWAKRFTMNNHPQTGNLKAQQASECFSTHTAYYKLKLYPSEKYRNHLTKGWISRNLSTPEWIWFFQSLLKVWAEKTSLLRSKDKKFPISQRSLSEANNFLVSLLLNIGGDITAESAGTPGMYRMWRLFIKKSAYSVL